MLDGMADAQREVERYKLQRELSHVLGQQRLRYPKELYKGEVWRLVWSCEEHAAFKIEGWTDAKNPGTEYRPYTAVGAIPKDADRVEAVGVPNFTPAKPALGQSGPESWPPEPASRANSLEPTAAQDDAKCVYERERAAAYRDFYQELEIVGKLTVAQAVSHKPFREAIAEIGKLPSDYSPASQSRFERVLFSLYERIIVAYKRSLVDAYLATSTVVRRLAQHAESVFQEVYLARIEEFSQRAGFYAEKAFPEVYLRLLPENARGQTSRLFRQLEDEILATEESTSVGGDVSPQWAVCPRFLAGDLAVIKEPLLFPSKARAQDWLDKASIFVHEWNHDQAKDSKSRDEWLQGIASMWIGSENTTLPRLKRVPVMPVEPGDNVYVCSLRKWVRSACKDVMTLPIPVHKLEDDTGPACPLRLSSLLDPDHLDPDPAEFDELLEMATVGEVDSWISCLAPDWDFPGIERQARTRSEWHNFEGLQIDSLRRLFCRLVLGLEQQLTRRHPRLSATALRAFWTSWQVKNHLYEFGRRVDEYVSQRPRLQETLGRDAISAITFIEWKLRQICKNLVDTAGGYQRHWYIGSRTMDRLEAREDSFGRLVRQTMVGLKTRFGDPFAAIDAWLDILHKESPYSFDWLIEPLYIASAEYCAELTTRSFEANDRVSAAFFDDYERRFRELLDSGADLYAIHRGIPDGQPEQPRSTNPVTLPFADSGTELAPRRKPELGLTKRRGLRGTRMPDKGNLNILLDTDRKLKRAVTLDVARRFGGVSRRAIDAAAHKGSLKTEGKRQQRRVLVESLLEYFPLEK